MGGRRKGGSEGGGILFSLDLGLPSHWHPTKNSPLSSSKEPAGDFQDELFQGEERRRRGVEGGDAAQERGEKIKTKKT